MVVSDRSCHNHCCSLERHSAIDSRVYLACCCLLLDMRGWLWEGERANGSHGIEMLSGHPPLAFGSASLGRCSAQSRDMFSNRPRCRLC